MQALGMAMQVPLARDLGLAGIGVGVHSQLVEVGNSVDESFLLSTLSETAHGFLKVQESTAKRPQCPIPK
jgi:hypothetical protein